MKALRFSAIAHNGQPLPGSDLPYLVHITMVCMEVIAALREESVQDESLAVRCALLHDVLEDTPVTAEEMEMNFGPSVTAGVRALSKDQTIKDKSERMKDSLRRIREQPREVWMVKLADRITNLQPPPSDWSKDKVARYLAEAEEIDGELGGASPFLHARLQEKMRSYATLAKERQGMTPDL